MPMPAGRSQNLDGSLQDVQAVYQEIAEPLPVVAASPLGALLPRVLDGALALIGADFGNIQLLDPVSGSLRIVTQFGFRSRFLDHFAVVEDDNNSACGRAVASGAQVVVADVDRDLGFAPHHEVAAAAGFRAVQSTPLVTASGRLVGMMSTHFRHRYRPPEQDLLRMERQARWAGQAIATRLGLAEPEPRGGPTVDRMLSDLVARLFSVGLSVAGARSIVGGGPADERLAVATDEIDDIIRDVQAIILERLDERGDGHRARPPGVRDQAV